MHIQYSHAPPKSEVPDARRDRNADEQGVPRVAGSHAQPGHHGGDVYVDLYDYQLSEKDATEEDWGWPNQFGYTHPAYLDPDAEPFAQLHWRTHVCEEVE